MFIYLFLSDVLSAGPSWLLKLLNHDGKDGGNDSENAIWKSSRLQSFLIYSKKLCLQIKF